VIADAARAQAVLEGVSLPASRSRLLAYAAQQGAGDAVLDLLQLLPDREFRSLDEVGEALVPVQPPGPEAPPPRPRPESADPPGREGYTEQSPEPGDVRAR
jgi:hypothetical protein